MDIYIALRPSWQFTGRRLVFLKDIAEIWSPSVPISGLEDLVVHTVQPNGEAVVALSAVDVVRLICRSYPTATVQNLGQDVVLLECTLQKPQKKPVQYLKVAAISLVLFFGASTAILSFHHDGEIPKVMQDYYRLFTGEENERPYLLEIPYTIGLSAGILLFFNHFSSKASKQDPTPIEVQITTYETEVNNHKIAAAQKKKEDAS